MKISAKFRCVQHFQSYDCYSIFYSPNLTIVFNRSFTLGISTKLVKNSHVPMKDINRNCNEFASIMNKTTIQKNHKSDHCTVSLLQLESKHNILNIHVYIYILNIHCILQFGTSISDDILLYNLQYL